MSEETKGGKRGSYSPPAKQFNAEKWGKWLHRMNTEHLEPRVVERRAAIEHFRGQLK